MRVGIGYDVHRLAQERRLVLGGVEIPYPLGLAGHSDADVLIHAMMDALLGAIGQGDIGKHFPDSDQRYRGISSLRLLERVMQLVRDAGYVVGNLDAVVIAQKPKLAKYFPEMRRILAQTMGCDESQINLKATTEEGLGFTGREEGIAASAVCLLVEEDGR
ncbi:2-C-methyl-D-erythritol 2,4-cyclodiphosphate synthase [Bianquea renquensis]|uniref:2-C-methyl-D-erythritol 2,4-cyclodiphosphate synthase n=1 Tax=Bianquea renquensis TaxID=2763661 RepID=A0A926HYI8_9FIRM|nr:2-C-methyl-D-erythritol 2,4-cyclodiphosphate synthase [Bianquea renquensis]MBC8544892.1 2-C-methyl-D-erythritol 2,4-cyclodiphosphate synthase [Bianquea renquensis]